MTLDSHNTSLLTGEGKKRLEQHRKYGVPRFLFRAFTPKSGGGPQFALNDTDSIRPHAFVSGRVPAFYRTPENLLHQLARAHYHGKHQPLSPFSSWAASLHLVLCYAHCLGPDSYIGVIDREKLKNDVLIWHAPYLITTAGHHEYLAYGVINGAGYKAAALNELLHRGLYDVFTELRNLQPEPSGHQFGYPLRNSMFRSYQPLLDRAERLMRSRSIAAAFGDLWFPVVTALVCIRPEPWFVDARRNVPSEGELGDLLGWIGVKAKPSWLQSGLPWLQYGAVQTGHGPGGFPDVKQWIDLLSAIASYGFNS